MGVGVFNTLIDIKELKLYNPPGFPDALMVNMPEIYIDYDLGALLKKRVHLQEVRLNLKEFIVVKNEKKELNLNALTVVKTKGSREAGQKEGKMPEVQIDDLRIKIGKVIYKDYSRGAQPTEREFNINVDEHYENITDAYTFGSLIIVKALRNTAIGRLINFDVGKLQQGAGEALRETVAIGKETVGKALETSKEAIEKNIPFED
jgi:uncharacterized protein involved in outer membrane biogenesis